MGRVQGHDEVVYRWVVSAGFGADAAVAAVKRVCETFSVTRDDWGAGDLAGRRLRASRQQEALAFAARLMSEGDFGWVRLQYQENDAEWDPSGDADGGVTG